MRDLTEISREHLRVCKIGQGAACCRYLVLKPPTCCAKGTSMQPLLDARVAAGKMNAQGDNCPGYGILDEEASCP